MIKQKWLWGAVLFHYLILILFTAEIIPQAYKRDGYLFWFHHGGDDYGYYEQTQAILRGDFRPNKFPLGFPILSAPLMALLQPDEHDAFVEPIALLWAVVMFPVGQWLLAEFAYRVSGRRDLALMAVWLWTALPLLTYMSLRGLWNAEMAEIAAVHMTWAQMLSDGPAALFTLLCALGFLRVRNRHYPSAEVLALGWLCGFLMMIRLTGVLTLGALGLILLAERRPRQAAWFVVGALIGFGPQWLYNWHFFGGPLTSGYSVLDELPPDGLLSLSYLVSALEKLWTHMGVLFPAIAVVAFMAFALALKRLWRWDKTGTALIALWVMSYGAFYSVYYYTWTGSLFRFAIPVLPPLAILAAVLLDALVTRGGPKDAASVRRY